ncbi:putative PurR-regulated permease PerM [Chitinophaga skermanii]|uniref:Putative PurR-regulated permease PerM n=1 Tax=Chitinophaga skermanii TaxID=331697 RepID=A0A327QDY2_9BACT|nr:AI-2E family transporter [Chitinophaga skermanii]RAJ01483.1 putative PurR-regulated permease PerM [Chitinophaga skermanii]
MSHLDNGRLKQIGFLLIILFLGIVLFKEMYAFFPGFLGAVTLYILTRKYMFRMVEQRGWGKRSAATVIMLATFLVILLPIGMLVNMLTAKVGYAVSHSSEMLAELTNLTNRISQSIGYNVLSEDRLQRLIENVTGALPGFLGATFNTLTAIAIMYFIYFFMLTNARQMEEALYEYIPLKDENVLLLSNELRNMVVSNAVGIPLIALIQSVIALVGYFIFQVPEPIFWFVVTCFTAMLPIVGAAAVYVPLGIYIISTGETWMGVGLLLYSFVVVGLSDNVFRFMLAKKIGDVHPLITIFGVIIGVNLFGFIGLIFGPLLISMFIVLLRIYSNEYFVKTRTVKVVKTVVPPKDKKK